VECRAAPENAKQAFSGGFAAIAVRDFNQDWYDLVVKFFIAIYSAIGF